MLVFRGVIAKAPASYKWGYNNSIRGKKQLQAKPFIFGPFNTGMLGIVVVTGNRENDVKSVASVLNEIGVGGLNIEISTDNEPYLMDLVEKGLRKSNARAYHWRIISEYRPQAKGVERAVGIAKEGTYTKLVGL